MDIYGYAYGYIYGYIGQVVKFSSIPWFCFVSYRVVYIFGHRAFIVSTRFCFSLFPCLLRRDYVAHTQDPLLKQVLLPLLPPPLTNTVHASICYREITSETLSSVAVD